MVKLGINLMSQPASWSSSLSIRLQSVVDWAWFSVGSHQDW